MQNFNNNRRILFHPFFLLNLLLLLINDIFLKYQYANWFTGKLSDVTGIIVLTLFLIHFFPGYKKQIALAISAFFIWWKSSLSQSFIELFNATFYIKINRVIDYTDLFALVIIPFIINYKFTIQQINIKYSKVVFNFIIITCLFAFSFTSVMQPRYYFAENENSIYYKEAFSSGKTEGEILNVLKRSGIIFYKNSVKHYRTFHDKFYHKIHTDSVIRWSPVANNEDSTLYVRKEVYPYYVIPWYVIEGDTLRNIEFSIFTNDKKKKKTIIEFDSFQTTEEVTTKKRKKYTQHFENLFK